MPAPEYDVVVFQNRFPALTAAGASAAVPASDGAHASSAGALASVPAARAAGAAHPARPSSSMLRSMAGEGRCEVICFSSDHDLSFADLSNDQARLVLDVWIDRTRDLAGYPGIEQVFCFENRGPEIGVTQTHPHGQIYAYPFPTPRTNRMLDMTASYRRRFGRNVFDDLLATERADGSRIVAQNAHWLAFVPYAARWPYEVHLFPLRRHTDLTRLDENERDAFPAIYLDLLRRFDQLFDIPGPTSRRGTRLRPMTAAATSRSTSNYSPTAAARASSNTSPARRRAWTSSPTTSRPSRPRSAFAH